jgi:PST family polysaccharide transporter
LASSVGWTAVAKVITQLFAWVLTFLVARILSPSDFGLYGMASVFFWAVFAIGEFGLGSAIIKQRDLSERQIAQINGFMVLTGLASAAVVAASAGPLAVFFHEPALHEIILAASVMFVIASFRNVPNALLQRELRFKRLAFNESLRAGVMAVSVFGLALLGFGVWSLVLGNILATLVGTLDLLGAQPHRLEFPHAGTIRAATTFGRDVVITRFSWYAMFNADFLVAGRTLGKAALGIYSFAWTLASLPVEKISLLVTRVSMPHFSAVQHQPTELVRYLRLMTGGLAFITFPAAIGIGILAEDLVRIALGDQWLGVVLPLQILAVVAPLRAVGTLFPQLIPVLNQTRFGVIHGISALAFLVVAFWVGSHWGTTGIATAWVVAYPLMIAPIALRVCQGIGLRFRDYLRWLAPPATGSVIMGGAVLAARAVLLGGLPLVPRVIAEVAMGLAVYGLSAWILDRDRILGALAIVRRQRAGQPVAL